MSKMQLRDYQLKIINNLKEYVANGNPHILMGSPTGSGKSIMIKHIIDGAVDKGKRVLILAPRRKLIYQLFKTIGRPGATSVTMGNEGAYDKSLPIQLSSIDSLRNRLKKYGKKYLGEIDLILIDEAHMQHNGITMELLKEHYWDNAVWIGLSATPIDELGYRLEGYDHTTYEIQTEDLIAMGFLTPVECFAPVKPNLDNVKIQAGDYAIDQIEKIMEDDSIIKNTFEVWNKYARGLKTMVFCVSIIHAEIVKKEFVNNGIKAGISHSKMSDYEQEVNLEKFKTGEFQILVNVSQLTTGYDEPSVECLLLARPTKSTRLYLQIIGRGIRTNPGKDQCLILDCAGNIKDNGYPTSRRNFNRPKPLKGQHKPPEEKEQEPPECDYCGNVINPEDRGRKIIETEDDIQTIFTCPNCGREVKTITVKKSDVELEAIEDPKQKKLKEQINYGKMTNQFQGYQELRKIAHQAGYKNGWSWVGSKAITKHNLWPQAAQIFQRVNGMGLAPSVAINELREIITARGEQWG